MATIPSYLSWVPKTGTGNAQIKINSVNPYTGRTDRSTSVPGKIVGKSNAVTVTVLEKAADEFITPDGLTINVAKGGETIHVTGKSNSKLLTFTWKTNFGIANVTSFKVNGSTTATSGTAITGDPGATGEYTYDVTVVVPKNETIKARSATLEIKGEGSTVIKTITITQALGDSYLYLNSQGTTTATVTIPKGGGEQTLSVLSNDEWTFEPAEQGAVNLTVVDSETKAKIAAYVYDKDTGGILGQVTKDTPLQLTGDVNTSRILRFVSSGYIEVEQLVTYAIPTAEVTVEMDKVPVQTGTIYATAVNTESTALNGVTFEYKLSTESNWKLLGNDESTTGKSEAVTAPVGTSVNFRASKTGYITNTGTGTINSTGEHSVTIVLEELPPEPEEVSVTIKAYEIYDDNKLYLAADIKEISSTGTIVGTTRPNEPLVITRNKGSVITYYALPLSSDWYHIGHEEVVFDTDKTVEILCLRNNNGLIKVRTRDALTGCMISNTIYDETGKKIGNCDSSEDGYVSEANPIGFERNYKTLGDTRYEATEPALFIAVKPSEAVVNYIDLHPKEGQDYIALKFIDSVTKAPITTGISCWFSSTVKTIVTDYQGIAHISGTYDSKVVILVRRDGYTEYNQSYDNLANHSVTTIELVPEPVFENDGIDYMQIEGDGIEHPIFRVGDVESN